MLIVGSTAMSLHAKWHGFAFRKPQDLDIMCTKDEMLDFVCDRGWAHKLEHRHGGHWILNDMPTFKHIEFQVAEDSPAVAMYLKYVSEFPSALKLDVYGEEVPVAPIEVLYSLKRSHRFLARHWEKHIRDYHTLKNWSFSGIDIMAAITKIKQAETKHNKTPSLNKTKEEFFDDHVSNHTFEHDQIHEVMAHRERPMFEYIKDDTDTVKCSKEKFMALHYAQQMQCVLEEAYVIALERGVIPMLYEGKKLADPETALQWSLMRICTTLCSGWFRDFAVENYPNIWAYRNADYATKFLKAVDEGRIQRIIKQEVTHAINATF